MLMLLSPLPRPLWPPIFPFHFSHNFCPVPCPVVNSVSCLHQNTFDVSVMRDSSPPPLLFLTFILPIHHLLSSSSPPPLLHLLSSSSSFSPLVGRCCTPAPPWGFYSLVDSRAPCSSAGSFGNNGRRSGL